MTTSTRVRRKATRLRTPDHIRNDIRDIVQMEEEIKELQAALKVKTSVVTGYMDSKKLDQLDGAEDTQMKREIKKGRNSSAIEPLHMYNAVNKNIDDFFQCVKVIQGEAAKVVPGNVLDKIKTVVPGKDKEVFVASVK